MTTATRIQNLRQGVEGVEWNIQKLVIKERCKQAPLVFLHDALGSIPQWKGFPLQVAEQCNRNAWVIEREGHGSSSPFTQQRRKAYLQHEATEVLPKGLHAIDAKRPVLIGHSDGGTIALIYAAHGNPRAVVAMAPHIFVEEITLNGIREAVQRKEHILNKLSRFHGSKTETLFKAWADTWLSPGFRFWDIREQLKDISCPLLLIQGDNDPYGSSEQVREICRRVKGNCQLEILPSTGHFPHHQRREQVTHLIDTFIKKHL
jgi:pimeloyl-ACP methyl ester carboxylesterase